jgi:hypothetical protein
MAKCDSCGTIILFGGKRDENGRFCNRECQEQGAMLALSKELPEAAVQEQLRKTHQGLCPKCGGSGPVDVYVSHRVWSAVLLTSWASTPQVSCRPCGRKSQWMGIGYSLALGWWGFPAGFVVTPIQIGRNLLAMGRSADASTPSPQLEKIVRMTLAAQVPRKPMSYTPL